MRLAGRSKATRDTQGSREAARRCKNESRAGAERFVCGCRCGAARDTSPLRVVISQQRCQRSGMIEMLSRFPYGKGVERPIDAAQPAAAIYSSAVMLGSKLEARKLEKHNIVVPRSRASSARAVV